TPGTLLISEVIYITKKAAGHSNVPGITDVVHTNNSFISAQLWALGRIATPEVLTFQIPPLEYASASPKPVTNCNATPGALTISKIKEYVQDYAQAVKNSIKAGFNGIEINIANGYLIDQFLQDVSNERMDENGVLEIVDAIVKVVGEDHTVIYLSPWNTFQGAYLLPFHPIFHFRTHP
ncbi:hypothetical protein M422DRAFT_171853, partial [Sphaerobolus stellatus SS14]